MKVVMTDRSQRSEAEIRDGLSMEVKILHLRAMLAHLLSIRLKALRRDKATDANLKVFIVWANGASGHTEIEIDCQKVLDKGLPVYLSEEATTHEFALIQARSLAKILYPPTA